MRRARFGSTTGGSLDALDAQLGTGNENGNNPDHDLVARDSTGSIVARYDESAGAWQFEGDLVVDSATVFDAGADTVGDGTTSANHQSVSTKYLNNVVWVRPDDDIQTVLDSLSTPSRPQTFNNVKLRPGTLYSRSSGITIPRQTILDLNGAGIDFTADVDGVTLGAPGAYLIGPGLVNAFLGGSYTSTLVKVDTASGQFTQTLDTINQNTVGVLGYPHIRNSNDTSRLLVLDSSGQSISIGNRFEIRAFGGQHHVEFRTNNGNFINGVAVDTQSWHAMGGAHIAHTNRKGAEGPARSIVRGVLQCSSNQDHAIENQTTLPGSVNFYGQVWDAHLTTGPSIRGDGIRVRSPTLGGGFATDYGVGTVLNGKAKRSLSGAAPDATNYLGGDIVEDTDNAGDVYLVLDNDASGNVTQIGT